MIILLGNGGADEFQRTRKRLEPTKRKLYQEGRYEEAIDCLNELIALIEKGEGPNTSELGSPLNNLAMLYERRGKDAEAEALFKRSLNVMRAAPGRDHDTGRTLRSLGNLYARQGRAKDAEGHLRQARQLLAGEGRDPSGVLGFIESELGEVLMTQGRFSDALQAQENALACMKAHQGETHPDIGTVQNNIGHTLLKLGREDEAEGYFSASLTTLLATLNPEDTRVSDTVESLAEHYRHRGRVSEEIAVLSQYLRHCEGRLHDHHPVIKDKLLSVAHACRLGAQYGKGERYYKRAIAGVDEASEAEFERIAVILNGLGAIYRSQGRYVDAEAFYNRALEFLRRKFGHGTVHETAVLANLADLRIFQGHQDEAEHLLNSVLAIREEACGPEDVAVARTLHTIVLLHLSKGEGTNQALERCRRAIRIKEKALGRDHLEVASSVGLLGSIFSNRGSFREAGEAYQRSAKIRENVLGNAHGDVGLSFHNVGVMYADQGWLEEAEPFLRQALLIFERAHGPNHRDVALALTTLATVLEKQGRNHEAQPLLARAERIPGWEVMDIPVLYATDRLPNRGTSGDQFSSVQSTELEHLAIGSVVVRAPKVVLANRASRSADALGLLHRAGGEQTQEAVLRVLRADNFPQDADLAAAAGAHLSRATKFRGQGLVYVHGFNNSFDEAAQRAAMISFDLDFDGATFVFSWASYSRAWRYSGDRKRARNTVPFLVEMLERIGRVLPDMKLHVFAHSTGAEIVVNAMQALWNKGTSRSAPCFGELILAHADVKQGTLARTLLAIQGLGLGVTTYFSGEDRALSLSRWLRGDQERVGSHPIYLRGVDAIDVAGLGIPRDLNHNVFVRNPIVFGDIARLLSTGVRPPDTRTPSFRKLSTADGISWRYRPMGSGT